MFKKKLPTNLADVMCVRASERETECGGLREEMVGLGVEQKVLESSCRLPVADQLPVLVALTNVVVVLVAVAGAATLAVLVLLLSS